MLHLNSASSSHKDQVGVITLISYYFKIESVKVSFSHASDSVWYYLYWSARHKGRADLLTLRCNWNNRAWTDLNMDASSEADPSEKIWFAWWNHQEKLLQCVHTVHVCCFECMKIISKLFLKKLFLVHNIPFTAEITFLRTGVVGFLDEWADTSFASGSSFPGQVKVWFTTGVWFRSEVTVPDTWSAERLMSVPLNGPWRCLLNKLEHAVKPRCWQQLGERSGTKPRRDPAERSRLWSFLWSGLQLQTAVIEGTVAGPGGWKWECKRDQHENRFPCCWNAALWEGACG